MRRSDKEVTDFGEICQIIEQCDCCRLGFYDGQEVYIVPLSFGYEAVGDGLTLYFHGAKVGRKISLIEQVDSVGFEMDANYQLKQAPSACSYSANYSSIIGTGAISMVETVDEQIKALQLLMERTTGTTGFVVTEPMLKATSVFKVEVSKLSCKRSR